jgi:hypothetical protein
VDYWLKKNTGESVVQTGNFRKPSRLVFSGAVWDVGRRRRGGIDLLRVSSWFGGSWIRIPSHSAPSQYKSERKKPQNKLRNARWSPEAKHSFRPLLHSPGSLSGPSSPVLASLHSFTLHTPPGTSRHEEVLSRWGSPMSHCRTAHPVGPLTRMRPHTG